MLLEGMQADRRRSSRATTFHFHLSYELYRTRRIRRHIGDTNRNTMILIGHWIRDVGLTTTQVCQMTKRIKLKVVHIN